MTKITDAIKPKGPVLRIGNYTLHKCKVVEGIWIKNKQGEGMQVEEGVFAALLDKFWADGF